MTDLLIITTLDVEGRNNNREHHAIKALRSHYDRVTVVYRRRGTGGRAGWAMLRSETRISVKDGVTFVAVLPALNPPDGAVRLHAHAGGRTARLRHLLAGLLDSAGILRDLCTISALAAAARGRIRTADTLVEAFGPWASTAAGRLRREGLIRHHVYIDRDYEPGFMVSPLRRRWAGLCESRAAARADLTLSIGGRLADRFRGISGANVRLSPTGVDLARFRPVIQREPLPRLIFSGEVAPWSGIEEAIAALGLLRRRGWDASLDIHGPCIGPYRAELDRVIGLAGLRAHVVLHGSQPRGAVLAALERGGIGLAVFRPHPLRIHAAPLKLWEYLAAGLPVLALSGSEAGDLVTRSGAGLTCAAEPVAIAETLQRMLGDAAGFAAMSEAGPRAAAGQDWSAVFAAEQRMLAELQMGRLGLPGHRPGEALS
ncbi:glycosyltransferase [Paracoccus ravus]|uniref:glycosyltransferase n=1 Tax=Paracoccus ravus TaxID=2447760 RepID=UPI00106E991A|nr:glycosyltransferase [Paracoccus ravus]